jgi:putative two-component system response regulator
MARIVAVADVFDAMTSHRSYRAALPADVAFLELLKKAGTHFDPNCVQAFVRQRRKIEHLVKPA